MQGSYLILVYYFCALTKSQWIRPDISTLRLLYRRILQSHTCTSADSPSQRCLLDRTPRSSALWTLEDTDTPPWRDRRELRSHTCTADCSPAPSVCHHRLKGNGTNSYLLIMLILDWVKKRKINLTETTWVKWIQWKSNTIHTFLKLIYPEKV